MSLTPISEPLEAREAMNRWLSAAVLLDDQGTILFANNAWRRFMSDNGGAEDACGPGVNYLKVCSLAQGDERQLAMAVAQGIHDVLNGRRAFYETDYPCHAPHEARWFRMRVEPFFDEYGARLMVLHSPVVSSFLEREPFGQRGTRLETLLDALPLAVAIVDPDTSDILYANPRLAHLLNVSDPVGLTGARWSDFAPDPGAVRAVLRERTQRQEETDVLIPRHGGPVRVLRSCSPVQFYSQPALMLCFMAAPQNLESSRLR
jgi:PAS domain-containing protein